MLSPGPVLHLEISGSRVRSCRCPSSAGQAPVGQTHPSGLDGEVQSSSRCSRRGLRHKSLLHGHGQRQARESAAFPGRALLAAVGAGNWRSRQRRAGAGGCSGGSSAGLCQPLLPARLCFPAQNSLPNSSILAPHLPARKRCVRRARTRGRRRWEAAEQQAEQPECF